MISIHPILLEGGRHHEHLAQIEEGVLAEDKVGQRRGKGRGALDTDLTNIHYLLF